MSTLFIPDESGFHFWVKGTVARLSLRGTV
jgi:hypothetical protein